MTWIAGRVSSPGFGGAARKTIAVDPSCSESPAAGHPHAIDERPVARHPVVDDDPMHADSQHLRVHAGG
jgi:hypothetical protein